LTKRKLILRKANESSGLLTGRFDSSSMPGSSPGMITVAR
jgi:hypothetical protein